MTQKHEESRPGDQGPVSQEIDRTLGEGAEARAARRKHLARLLHREIDDLLSSRRARQGTALARVEDTTKRAGAKLWSELKKHPSAASLGAGGVGLAIAEVVGVGELLLGAIAGYAAYEVLKRGVPLSQALEEAERKIGRP